jgi:membrane-bound serine protease (ClpP class)
VLHLRLQGRLDRQQVDFAQRQLRQIAARKVNRLLVEIDLGDGDPELALTLASNLADLQRDGVRTVAWIPTSALGAAAILPLGCDVVWMGPQAEWGGVVTGGPPNRRREEPVNVRRLALALSELALRRQRSGALAAAMASNTEVVQQARDPDGRLTCLTPAELAALGPGWQPQGPVPECGTGQPLILSAQRANELGLAEEPVADPQAVATRLGLAPGERWATARQDWVDRLVFALNRPWVTGLLLLVALLLFYFEAHLPIGVFAIAGIVCFALFFWSRFLGGTAGWLEVILFVIGLACLGVELLVLPGFGVFGVSGIGLCLLSLIMAMQTTIIPHTVGDLRGLAEAVFVLGGACAGVLVLAAVVGRYLPELPILSRMVLTPPELAQETTGPQLRPELVGGGATHLERGPEWLGKRGHAASILRPAGRADFEGVPVDVVSEGPFIPAGRPIVVIDLRGAQVVVREVKPTGTSDTLG